MERYLVMRTRDELLRVKPERILYFEANKTRCKLLMEGGIQFSLAINIGKIEELLDRQLKEERLYLVRVGKSHIINKSQVLQINIPKQRLLLLDNGKPRELIVSKIPLKALKTLLERENEQSSSETNTEE
ncbi:MAG: LytTR family transcriptional regulator [Tannerellaceae bacterium]|jgi:DNA-binding LytR/AlgR family response regulator|nr:LytTR family transcriptional regulator [Tannerellaceae bacterium]